jgi:hypothetical protein
MHTFKNPGGREVTPIFAKNPNYFYYVFWAKSQGGMPFRVLFHF